VTGDRGHRLLPHTADLIVEAWGPSRVACMEEAVAALVESFADTSGADTADPVALSIERAGADDLLVALLEEVLYLVEVLGVVPSAAAITERDDGGLGGFFDVVPVAEAEAVGAAPKAVARSDLEFGADAGGRWSCRVTVDV
jgi:SHS2 domain-containing protein